MSAADKDLFGLSVRLETSTFGLVEVIAGLNLIGLSTDEQRDDAPGTARALAAYLESITDEIRAIHDGLRALDKPVVQPDPHAQAAKHAQPPKRRA